MPKNHVSRFIVGLAVDAAAQIIVVHELTQCGNDQGQLVPLVEAIEINLGLKPQQTSADSGYWSEPNLEAPVAQVVSTAMSYPDAQSIRRRQTEKPVDH